MFKKLLVANRSEIAIRILRAANELGIQTVAIYAHEDRFSVHRFKADEAYMLDQDKGPVGAYLDYQGIVDLAVEKGVDAIHPGYGFLSENPDFARACRDAGITFIGPDPELLDNMGDKMAARALAQKVNVPTLPGTNDPIDDRAEALKTAREIGFPLIIKAAFGGGGRGMRVVNEEGELAAKLDEAQAEAASAFGNPAVFLERFIGRAKHIEVQILGDRHGNVLHLHERDCSVQRRHQKVVEIAPSIGLPDQLRHDLCNAAVRLAKEIGYNNAGTVEFLVDADRDEWFFIEMNPRIQVEHTVTEVITNIDLVRSQILVAAGHELHGEVIDLPAQEDIPRFGVAIQCRITTEDPSQNFAPDTGRIATYRSCAGLGIRLDAAMAAAGAVITPYYDSLLVKLTASARNFEQACARIDRALREFRIRGVKTNIPFLENVINHPEFRAGNATTRMIDTTPELFHFKPRRDRATKLLRYLGDVSVNENPYAKGFKPSGPFPTPRVPKAPRGTEIQKGSRDLLLELGATKFSEWVRNEKRLLLTDTTFRDAHQSLFATRMRTYDMLRVAPAVAAMTPNLFSMEMWGGATFDTAMRFLREDPWQRLTQLREAIPNICFQMLFRGSNAVGYTNYPDNVVAGFIKHAATNGMDIFRIFDSLNYLPNLKAAMEAVQDTHAICEGTICYTGDILDEKRDKYSLKYYVNLAKELEQMGAHMLCIKDMAGLCRPAAASKLVSALRDEVGLPIHFHTHDTSGISAASVLNGAHAGVDIVDAAIASMSGGTSQPNLNSIVAALQHTERDTELDLDALNRYSDYWERVRPVYKPFDTAPPHGTAEVYLHEMPGGQFTNLKEQAEAMGLGRRWPEIARTYADVNDLFGDIVKVTPSSKVVGDMTMFLVTKGIKASEVYDLPSNTPWPESVIDMLSGGLGQPPGGFPQKLVEHICGDRVEIRTKRPGEYAAAVDFEKSRKELEKRIERPANDDDVWSYLMYPDVFVTFDQHRQKYSDVSVLPTSAYFYGLLPDEEVSIEIEQGKTLITRLTHVREPDEHGIRTVSFELNGLERSVEIADKAIASDTPARAKAEPGNEAQVGAPMPGLVASIAVSVGDKVEEGDALLTLEAMKMFTTVPAPHAGTIKDIHIGVGEDVETKDLIVTLEPAE
ncbi:pyruvate carboxylase [Sulfuriroseicoccus oceanibius]|uniref:Pyruvate carboxylase n=1 Tax=Sulfuriroseicoccus oceanibius TaxID=2707525 RepID=A0A6B3L8H0_9BACT|nr:pyruvate carboxylase [Sulfuriroseicoccus oceanibius]QQL43807.1 pyruvate carboxylase [Sulfuriroseicoccus oceanibius]